MSKYIKNLSNDLIGKHDFKAIFRLMRASTKDSTDHKDQFIKYVEGHLEAHAVKSMSPETLGRVMCSFDRDDLKVVMEDVFKHVHYHPDDMEKTFREIVSSTLACAIWSYLSPEYYV